MNSTDYGIQIFPELVNGGMRILAYKYVDGVRVAEIDKVVTKEELFNLLKKLA